MFKRTLYIILVLAGVAASASIVWRYNTYVYHKALMEAPEKVRLAIKKVVEIPLKYKVELIKWFPFSQEDELRQWEEKVFKGRVVYTIEKEDKLSGKDLSYVRGLSEGKASALYYKIKLDVRNKHPVISWKWKVNRFPAKTVPEDLESENEHDFAGRVYVIFPAGFITNWKVLEYLWAEKLPAGTSGTSPFSKNIKLTVLRSGQVPDGSWAQEERDLIDDYTKAFGEPPRHDVGAVAFMTNAEHTRSVADANYDEIRLGYAEDGEAKD
ncbi:MAG: DUF3047 domain-containing protein [Candidatus Omnitrophica bacterium]|nr:DUF3047 domain-containing protein [Candidatus Omnitrophota bacterium]